MKKIIGLAFLLSLGLTGCISAYDLSEEQAGIITEYASSVVLKHDRAYADKLTNSGKPEEKAANDKDIFDTENTNTDNTGTGVNKETSSSKDPQTEEEVQKEPTQASLTKVIGKDGFTIKYNSYAMYDTYPKNAKGYMVTAPKDGKLLIAELSVKNTTKSKKKFNTVSDNWEITLNSAKDDVVSVSYYPSISVLPNALQYADISIEAGKTKKMVVVFEVPADAKYDKYTLSVKNGNLVSDSKLK